MKIHLYTNNSPLNKITKELVSIGEYEGQLNLDKEECSILNPHIRFIGLREADIRRANYCYISNFGRYYFITDEPIFRSNVIILRMTCDPLMSYKEVLLNNEVYIDRYENSTKDLPDSLQAIKPNINTQIVPFNTVNLQRDSFVVAITGDGE